MRGWKRVVESGNVIKVELSSIKCNPTMALTRFTASYYKFAYQVKQLIAGNSRLEKFQNWKWLKFKWINAKEIKIYPRGEKSTFVKRQLSSVKKNCTDSWPHKTQISTAPASVSQIEKRRPKIHLSSRILDVPRTIKVGSLSLMRQTALYGSLSSKEYWYNIHVVCGLSDRDRRNKYLQKWMRARGGEQHQECFESDASSRLM